MLVGFVLFGLVLQHDVISVVRMIDKDGYGQVCNDFSPALFLCYCCTSVGTVIQELIVTRKFGSVLKTSSAHVSIDFACFCLGQGIHVSF
jgi:hypothetical protein